MEGTPPMSSSEDGTGVKLIISITVQWLKWVGTRGNAVPPKAFSVPSKKNSVPTKVISVPAKNTIAFPPKDFAFPPRKFAELQRTSSTTPPSKLGRKTRSTTPPPLEFEFTELHRLPPLEIGPENSFNYPPPSNSRNFIDYPPSKSGRKTPSTTPPRIHGTSSTTSFVSGVGGTHCGTHWNAALKAFPL